MAMNSALIAELKHEAGSTRKILERVPLDNHSWKPHEKSMELKRIAVHIAEIPVWINRILSADSFDFAAAKYDPTPVSNSQELVELLDKRINDASAALEAASDEDLKQNWAMRAGDHVVREMPKVVAIRNLALNHIVHHRGQLSVYLRLLDVPVPGMYGPSADER